MGPQNNRGRKYFGFSHGFHSYSYRKVTTYVGVASGAEGRIGP
jgi:hypothetical protein